MSDDSKSDSGSGSGATAAHPVHDVIQAFGGIRPMANKLGIAVSTVQGWKNRDAIPDSRHADIREAARKHGVSLSADLLQASGDGSGEDGAAGESPGGVVEAEEVASGEPEKAATAGSGSGTRASGSSGGARTGATTGTSAAAAGGSSAASSAGGTGTTAGGATGGSTGSGGGDRGGDGTGGGRGDSGGDDVPPPPRVVERPRATGWVPGLLLGAAVLALGAGGAVVLREHWLPMVDGGGAADPVAERFQSVEGQLSSLKGRINGLSSEVDSAARAETLKSVRETVQGLSDQVTELEKRVAAGTAAAGEGGGIAPKAITDLTQRQDELAGRQDKMAGQQTKLGKQQDKLVEQQDQLAGKQSELAEQQGQLVDQQKQITGRLDDMNGRFEGVTKRLDTIAQRLDTVGKRLDTLAQETVKAEDFQALTKRVDGLRKEFDSLASVADIEKTRKQAADAAQQAAAKELGRAMAVVQLQDALRDSDPYADTLSAVRKRLPDTEAIGAALDTLAQHAESGVPTRAALLGDFRERAGRAVAVSAGEGEGDLMTGVLRRLGDVVRVRPVGQDQSGSGVGAVLARAEAKLAARDLQGAIGDVKSLSGAPAENMASWLDDARARLAVDSAIDTLRNRVIAPDGAANGNGDGA